MILVTPSILVALYAQAILHLSFALQRIPLPVKEAHEIEGYIFFPWGSTG